MPSAVVDHEIVETPTNEPAEQIIEPLAPAPASTVTAEPDDEVDNRPAPLAPAERIAAAPEALRAPVTAPTSTIAADTTALDVTDSNGDICIDADNAADATTQFFANSNGVYYGGDYQRAIRLPDGRVLWTLQDAFLNGGDNLPVHNIGIVQDGTCFTVLHNQGRSWLFLNETDRMNRWYWIMDGYVSTDDAHIYLYVAEMHQETGSYLTGRTNAVATHIVTLDAATLDVISIDAPLAPTDDLYGWTIAANNDFVYLYGWCYRQFGWNSVNADGNFDHDRRCTNINTVARIPVGADPTVTAPTYWNGTDWGTDPEQAVSVFGSENTLKGIANSIEVMFDGEQFRLITNPDDWWNAEVLAFTADSPEGPWTLDGRTTLDYKCERCNTYFASWMPFTINDEQVWAIGHNHWTQPHTTHYRPTVHTTADFAIA